MIQIEKIIESIPKEWSELEKARYVYIELAKELAYDTNFLFGKVSTKRKIYKARDKHKVIHQKIGICNSINRIYCEILQQMGIKADSIIFEEGEDWSHDDVILKIEGKNYIVNIVEDLMNVQIGAQTKEFASEENLPDKSFSVVPVEELRRIDEKIGYLKGDYTNEFFELLKKEMLDKQRITNYIKEDKGLSEKEDITPQDIFEYKTEFLIKNAHFVSGTKKMRYAETKMFYKKLFKSFFTKKEQRKVKSYDCYYNEENGVRKMKMLLGIFKKQGCQYYEFSNEEKCFKEKDSTEIQDYLNHGMKVIGNNKRKELKMEVRKMNEKEK